VLGKLIRIPLKFAVQLTTIGLSKGPHITRYQMYKELTKWRAERTPGARILAISHSQNLAEMLGYDTAQVTAANFPEYNILDLPFEDNEFDLVVSDQVLEHVEGSPVQAMNEAFRVLKPGGLALHTTCFINPVHGRPQDFWRFTPEALEFLVKDKAEIIEASGWGNPLVWLLSGLGLRFMPIPHAKWHPLHWLATKNDPDWPIVTWVFAKKL